MDKHDEGRQAALGGAEFWDNPYSSGNSIKAHFDHWFAGWCNGRKEMADKMNEEISRAIAIMEETADWLDETMPEGETTLFGITGDYQMLVVELRRSADVLRDVSGLE